MNVSTFVQNKTPLTYFSTLWTLSLIFYFVSFSCFPDPWLQIMSSFVSMVTYDLHLYLIMFTLYSPCSGLFFLVLVYDFSLREFMCFFSAFWIIIKSLCLNLLLRALLSTLFMKVTGLVVFYCPEYRWKKKCRDFGNFRYLQA